jgi:enoyl-CoA hydratase/carnithine racemase
MDTDFETVELDFDDDSGIARLRLDRPDSLNALSATLRREYVQAFEALDSLDADVDGVAVRAVVVSGNGRAFCAGADVDEFAEGTDLVRPEVVYEAAGRFEAPVIADIDGYCLGGGLALALDCDFRFASERSEFGLPEVDLGLTVAGRTLPALRAEVGPSKAKRLATTGERFGGRKAAAAGLIEAALPDDELADRVTAFAETLAAKPPLAVRRTLDVVDAAGGDDGRLAEVRGDAALRRSRDHREAVRAFREGGDPELLGR